MDWGNTNAFSYPAARERCCIINVVKLFKKLFVLLYIGFSIGFLVYLVLPAPDFPLPPHDAVQSSEDADVETTLRRAYFTNYTREQVMDHYKRQFNTLPTLDLNYPPEDAQTLIRDQTRSTFLEELVHPFRESIYVNGFKPSQAKDDIWYKGQHFEEKITISHVPGNMPIRIVVSILTLASLWLVITQYAKK